MARLYTLHLTKCHNKHSETALTHSIKIVSDAIVAADVVYGKASFFKLVNALVQCYHATE